PGGMSDWTRTPLGVRSGPIMQNESSTPAPQSAPAAASPRVSTITITEAEFRAFITLRDNAADLARRVLREYYYDDGMTVGLKEDAESLLKQSADCEYPAPTSAPSGSTVTASIPAGRRFVTIG